jgi:hypothetical protein
MSLRGGEFRETEHSASSIWHRQLHTLYGMYHGVKLNHTVELNAPHNIQQRCNNIYQNLNNLSEIIKYFVNI